MPSNLTYSKGIKKDGLEFSYRYNVLAETGNKKYAKKEIKKSMRLVAVEFTNNTSRRVNFRNDVSVKMGGSSIYPLETTVIRQNLKQSAALHLLWGLLWVNIQTCEGYGCSNTPLPVGLVIGGANTIIASSANNNFESELIAYNMLNMTIEPGQTVHGLIGLSTAMTSPLSFSLNN